MKVLMVVGITRAIRHPLIERLVHASQKVTVVTWSTESADRLPQLSADPQEFELRGCR
jgi:hypothetical protein